MIAALGLVAVLSACTDDSASGPTLPQGWRWESYLDVELGVPGDWGYGGFGRWSAWCADGVTHEPAVARPEGVFGILCRDPRKGGVDPGALVANTGPFAAFVPAGAEKFPEEVTGGS